MHISWTKEPTWLRPTKILRQFCFGIKYRYSNLWFSLIHLVGQIILLFCERQRPLINIKYITNGKKKIIIRLLLNVNVKEKKRKIMRSIRWKLGNKMIGCRLIGCDEGKNEFDFKPNFNDNSKYKCNYENWPLCNGWRKDGKIKRRRPRQEIDEERNASNGKWSQQ